MKNYEINKIMIIGCCGAGKSTLSYKLRDHLNLPLYHLDQLFWKSGWKQVEIEEYKRKHQNVIQKPQWIIDGNFNSTMAERIELTDLVIILDLPRWQCLWGVFKRIIKYRGKTRPDMTHGCDERIDWEFIKYVYNFNRDQLPKTMDILNRYEKKKQIIQITNRKEIDKLLDYLALSQRL